MKTTLSAVLVAALAFLIIDATGLQIDAVDHYIALAGEKLDGLFSLEWMEHDQMREELDAIAANSK